MAALLAAAGVIGAGFASGREAAAFFAAYGGWGWAGLALAMLLVGWASCRPAQGLSPYLQVVWLLLLWTTLAATLAAGGELLKYLLDWPAPFGSALTALLAVVTRPRRTAGAAQALTVVVLAAAILFTGGSAFRPVPGTAAGTLPKWGSLPGITTLERAFSPGPAAIFHPSGVPAAAGHRRSRGGAGMLPPPLGALLAALLYASYTSALLAGGLPVRDADRRRAAWLGTTLVGLLSGVMVAALHCRPDSAKHALPMLAVAAGWHVRAGRAYAWLLWLAAANAAAANTLALGGRLAGGGRATAAQTLVAGLAWVASALGFGPLVEVVYPALGLGWLPALLIRVAGRGPSRLWGSGAGRYN